MPIRYDVGTLRPAQKRADGRLIVDAHLTRTGVFTYRNPDGTQRREYRPPEEVFRADSLASFALAPVTNDHPPENVTSRNARKYAVGSVGENVRQDGEHVAAQLVVFDQAVIDAMAAGKRDVSCGYECDLDETPGVTPSGERYDAIQRNIVGNHLAIVSVGRAGTARVRMDGATQLLDGADRAEEKTIMDPEKIIATERSRADAAEERARAEKARADKLEAERDDAREKLAKLEKERTDAAAAVPALVAARVALVTAAGSVLGRDVRLDAMDDRAIKLAVIKKITGKEIEVGRSDDYVTARYDAAIERAETSEAIQRGQLTAVVNGRTDGAPDAAMAARAEMIKRNQAMNSIDAAHAAGK